MSNTVAVVKQGETLLGVVVGGGDVSSPAVPDDGTIALQIANRIYQGVDLTVKHAEEIAATAGADQVEKQWNWIHERIQAVNWQGINIGDWIPLTLSDNTFFEMQVAGIDTYYRYGDTDVPHHIDFISRDCHPTTVQWNKVDYNNGLSTNSSPWLCSDLYHRLNSLSGNVPNATTANPATTAVDYTATGILDKLPSSVKGLIIEKRLLVPNRYTSGSLLLEDTWSSYYNVGKLWLPYVREVFDAPAVEFATVTMLYAGFVQYPLFANNMNKIKGDYYGDRTEWWLASVRGGSSSAGSAVTYGGHTGSPNVSALRRVPLCFRIA